MNRKFLCGTPKAHCSGSFVGVSSGLGGVSGGQKAHSGRAEAFKCHRKYKIQVEGYIPTDTLRELQEPPEKGGRIYLMAKQSHFGGELRKGKSGEKAAKASRFQPKGRAAAGMLF